MQAWGKVTHQLSDGAFSIDVDRMWKLYFDRRRTENYLTKSKPVPVEPTLLGPKVNNIEVDWDAAAADARGYAEVQTAATCYKLTAGELTGNSLRQHLKTEYGSLNAARSRFSEKLQANSQANNAALKSNVDNWDTAIGVARGVRSASTTVLAVGAVALTGGAAAGAGLAFTGVGAALTGVGKAQDSERHLTMEQAVGVAVVSGGFDFVTTILTGGIAKGAKLAWAGKAVVAFFVKVPTKTATSIMLADMTRRKDEPAIDLGAHAWSAIQDWAADEAAGAIAGKLLKIPQVNAALRKLAVVGASAVKDNASDLKGALVSKLVRGQAKKVVEKGVRAAGNAAVPTLASIVSGGAPKDPLPEAVIRQPVHGGAQLEAAVLNSIISPLNS